MTGVLDALPSGRSDHHVRETVSALIRAHRPMLVRLARGYVGADDAEDVVHDAVLAVLRRGPTLPSVSLGYLLRAVERSALSWLRRQRLRNKKGTASTADGNLHTSATRSERHSRLADLLRAAAASLPDSEREAFEIVRLTDTKLDEAARKLGISKKTLKQRLWRAQRRMKGYLNRQGINSAYDL